MKLEGHKKGGTEKILHSTIKEVNEKALKKNENPSFKYEIIREERLSKLPEINV